MNLTGQFYCAREAIPLLKAAGGGSIVNLSSNVAFPGLPLRAPYTASKWGVVGLTKTLAMEPGVHKIRVNALCPGSVSGERIDGVIERDAAERGLTAEQIRRVFAAKLDAVIRERRRCSQHDPVLDVGRGRRHLRSGNRPRWAHRNTRELARLSRTSRLPKNRGLWNESSLV